VKKLLLTSIAALFLATGTAHADPVYDDDWNWSGCKLETTYEDRFQRKIDEDYYSCEYGRDFQFFKRGHIRGYVRGSTRVCTIRKFEELPGTESPRLVWATCREGDTVQLEISKFYSCCGALMIKHLYVYPALTQ